MKFDTAKSVQVFGTSKIHQFVSTDEIIEFAKREDANWSPLANVDNNTPQHIRNITKEQASFFQTISRVAEAIDKFSGTAETAQQATASTNQLQILLNQITQGHKLTSESPNAAVVLSLLQVAPQAAAVILYLCHPIAAQQLGAWNSGIPAALVLKSILTAAVSSGHEVEVTQIRNEYERIISDLENKSVNLDSRETERHSEWSATKDKAVSDLSNWSSDFSELHQTQEKDWKDKVLGFDSEWSGIKRSLEESVSLAAPTTYWKKRSKTLTIASIVFAGLFSLGSGALVYLFFANGIPYIKSLHTSGSPAHVDLILMTIPILIPAFGGIWVLRILGRFLSTYARLSEDARERKTMVETFLALSREGADGNPLLRPEDRHLILKALFRTADGGADDDSPPFGLLDAIAKKAAS